DVTRILSLRRRPLPRYRLEARLLAQGIEQRGPRDRYRPIMQRSSHTIPDGRRNEEACNRSSTAVLAAPGTMLANVNAGHQTSGAVRRFQNVLPLISPT